MVAASASPKHSLACAALRSDNARTPMGSPHRSSRFGRRSFQNDTSIASGDECHRWCAPGNVSQPFHRPDRPLARVAKRSFGVDEEHAVGST